VSALRRHRADLSGAPITELGSGLDNAAYAVGELVLRAGDADIARESALLEELGPRLPLPIPRPEFADAESGVLAYRRLPGAPLLGRPAGPRAAEVLGRFLRELHAIDPAELGEAIDGDAADPAEWLDGLEGPPELLRLLRESCPEPAGEVAVAHADLGAEHILAEGETITGIIDWTDAAVTDPALDFARPLRDFGPGFLHELLAAYGTAPPPLGRIEFFARCAALEDLAYGRASGRSEYVSGAERSFEWLFPS
jgi:aminoglycoside phosphotransferase (APT) family kinase protein